MSKKMICKDEVTIPYNTRDTNGVDFIKQVKIKKFPLYDTNGKMCGICGKNKEKMCKLKDIVSANFTDYAYISGDYICEECADLFSIYFYNYIIDSNGIRLLNVRQLKDELTKSQKPPFMFVISTSQKKHLFYRSKWNYDNRKFAVNLETETIYTTPERMKELFDFVECCQTLGCSKEQLKNGIICQSCIEKNPTIGIKMLDYLRKELNISREIQIPLYCGQKRNIEEEEAKCCLISTLKI